MRVPSELPQDNPSLPDLAVVLVRPRNPLNIGAVARAMSNFGFLDLRISDPYALNIEAARSAVDAVPLLTSARVFDSLSAAIADCHHIIGTTTGKARALRQPIYALPAAARDLPADKKCALLFGSEKHGLTSEDLSHCQTLWHIPTRPVHLSMNLGQAAAICFYAIATSASDPFAPASPGPQAAPVATVETRERLMETLFGVLKQVEFAGAEDSTILRQNARRMTGNLGLLEDDARLLLGMLRRIGTRLPK